MYTSSPNPLIENSFLALSYLDPEYLFNHIVPFLGSIFNAKGLNVLYIILSVLVIFLLLLLFTLRLECLRLEKERTYLKHEITGYAHTQALKKENYRKRI